MIYELDIHATQNPKINILRRKKIALPEELIFIPIDFNKQDLSDVLFEAGYRSNERSLFLWEGVTMYLDPEAIGSTLDFIQHTAGNGNIVVFDYILASVLRRENRFYGEKEVYRTVSRAGEGWTFGIEDGEVERFLSERGFTVVDHYTSTELEKRYLTADDGTLFGRINGTHCIVIASAS